MIRSLYVDNYRSLVDFTWTPGKEVLMLGYNGSGKSSVIDAILLLQKWCSGEARLEDVLKLEDRTRWLDKNVCKFGLTLEFGGLQLDYQLDVEFAVEGNGPVVTREGLFRTNGQHVFERQGSRVFLDAQNPHFPINRQQSVFSTVEPADADPAIPGFLEALQSFIMVRPVPQLIVNESSVRDERPDTSLRNLVSWLQFLEDQEGFSGHFEAMLKKVWPEIHAPRFVKFGTVTSVLELPFGRKGKVQKAISYGFDQLSDGERMLVALSAIAAYQRTVPATTIIIDEPDNFVALLELQPWLLTMLDDRPDEGQLILVSHNSEIIQTMGEERVAFFSRNDSVSPTRVSGLKPDETGLPLAELVTRGWIGA